MLCYVQFFVTPWNVALQVPLSIGLFQQEYWSGLPFSPPGDHFDPGLELLSPAASVLADRFFATWVSWEAQYKIDANYACGIQFSQHDLLKKLSFPNWVFIASLTNISWLYTLGFIYGLCILFHLSIYLFIMPVPYILINIAL